MAGVFHLTVVVALVAAAINFGDANPTTIQKRSIINWYDCSGKPDGDYPHPYECTMYISCVAGSIAYEMFCAPCDGFPQRCPYGRDVFDVTAGRCLWADETECLVQGSTTKPPPTSTSESPPPPPPPTTTETEPTGGPEPSPTTTEAATSPPPPPPPTTTNTPPPDSQNPGDPCDPDICTNSGKCQSYLRCDRETSRLVQDNCGEALFWNPNNPDGTQHVHGGNCDFWENLGSELQHEYRKDPECLACFWKAKGECEQEYLYQPPDQATRNVLTLSCPQGLLFSLEKQTCQRCDNVRKSDGSACCHLMI